MKNSNSYESLSGRKLGMIFLVLLFLLIFMCSNKTNAQDRIGFAGISVGVLTPEKDFGGGIEVAMRKTGNLVGFGIQGEFIPENSDSTSFTFVRGFLLWRVTDNFSIRTAGGVEVHKQKEMFGDTYASFGFAPIFTFQKAYLGIQPNFFVEKDALLFSNVSFIIGLKL